MGKDHDPFELEPEQEPAAGKVPPPAPAPAPVPVPGPREISYEERLRERASEREAEGVDERTLDERLGRQVPVRSGPLPAPPGWPGEALRFGLLPTGPGFIGMAVTLLVAVDCLGVSPSLRFPAWLLKFVIYALLLRAQIGVAGQSAAGRDTPLGWVKALAFGSEDLRRLVGVLTTIGFAAVPALILLLINLVPWAVVLFAAASIYGVVAALGWAVSDPSLRWPWNALTWISTRPLHCVVVALSWWIVIATEFAIRGLQNEGLVLTAFVALILRAVNAYVLLLGARVLGVMGRAWVPAA